MKKLVSPGVVLIQSSSLRSPSNKFDPFASHGGDEWVNFNEQASSNTWFYGTLFNYSDVNQTFYIFGSSGVFQDGQAYLLMASEWVSNNGKLFGYGEFFNAFARAKVFEKVPIADWAAWLASH
jgi:hypothetical protein